MTDYKRKRLEAERERLQHEWEIRNDKLKLIGKQLAIETSATEKFKLEEQLKQEKIELKKLDQELEAIENLLHCQYGFDQKPSTSQTFQFEVVKVNSQGSIINRRNEEAIYVAEDLGNGVKLEMVQIPGGTFTMGSPESEAERLDRESPQRQVRVPGFFMGKYKITQAEYQAIMGINPASFKGEKRPVERVSWDDAVEFCEKLSQKTGKPYRLPSEAEWEYACRAGTTTPFYFGETITTDLVNYDGKYPYGSAPKGKYRRETTNVGIFPPNSFGLYDK